MDFGFPRRSNVRDFPTDEIVGSVSIRGPRFVSPSNECTWSIGPRGLLSPLTVRWRGPIDTEGTKLFEVTSIRSSGWLKVEVTQSRLRQSAVDSIWVTVSPGGKSCTFLPKHVKIYGPTVVKSTDECTWTARVNGIDSDFQYVIWSGVINDTTFFYSKKTSTVTGTVGESGILKATLGPWPEWRWDSISIRVDDGHPGPKCEGVDPI